jgi:hypothetical protein
MTFLGLVLLGFLSMLQVVHGSRRINAHAMLYGGSNATDTRGMHGSISQ